MYLMYLDESGHSGLFHKNIRPESDFFILGGVIVKEENMIKCVKDCLQFKEKRFPVELHKVPIHAVDLNNIGRSEKNPYEGVLTVELGKKLLVDCYDEISKYPIEAIAVIVDNVELKNKYITPYNPYLLAYRVILEKFSRLIIARKDKYNQLGIVYVAESSNNLKRNLQQNHELILRSGTQFHKDFFNIFDQLVIQSMDKSPFYEIADLICYAYHRKYYRWLCKHLGRLVPEDDFLSIIEPICTLEIGTVLIDGKVQVKFIPQIRQF